MTACFLCGGTASVSEYTSDTNCNAASGTLVNCKRCSPYVVDWKAAQALRDGWSEHNRERGKQLLKKHRESGLESHCVLALKDLAAGKPVGDD